MCNTPACFSLSVACLLHAVEITEDLIGHGSSRLVALFAYTIQQARDMFNLALKLLI